MLQSCYNTSTMNTDELLEKMSKLIVAKLEPLKSEMRTGFHSVNTKIDERSEQLLEIIVSTADGIVNEHEPRIQHIEQHLGIENPTKKN